MTKPMTDQDRFRGCLLGLAAGDAVGTTVEFELRGTFEPVTDMVGGGPFELEPGQWTDDTSMALCLGASLLHINGFDARDQMERYCRWRDDGYMSSTGHCFDIGNTVSDALRRCRETGDPVSGSTDPMSAGNGSIMRLAPVVMFFAPNAQAVARYSAESSRTTHGAAECIDACLCLAIVLLLALTGADKEQILAPIDPAVFESESIKKIAAGAYRDKTIDEIQGTGYVVESLEAALW